MKSENLRALLDNASVSFSSNVFFVDISGRCLTYAELHQQVNGYVEYLNSLALGKKSSFCFTLDLDIDTVAFIVALYVSGHIITPLYPETTTSTASYILECVNSSALFIDQSISTRYSDECLSFQQAQLIEWNEVLSNNTPIDTKTYNITISDDDIAGYIFSSGSTGLPKGITMTHRNLALGAKIVAHYTQLNKEDIILSTLRPNFDYGLNQVWQTLATGNILVCCSMRNPFKFYDHINKLKPTVIPLMPVIIDLLMKPSISRLGDSIDKSCVRFACSSGGKLGKRRLEWLENTFRSAWICPMYGLSEAFRSTYVPEEYYKSKSESIGIAIPTCRIDIVSENDELLGPGEIGEIVHTGGCISPGYLNNPTATASRFKPLPHSPLVMSVRSGDLGFKDGDGFLYYVGRKDDMMKISGIRVSPTEVENELATLAGICASVVFGYRAGEDEDESIVCCITVNSDFSIEQFIESLFAKFPRHIRPKRYMLFDEFPITGNGGKIDRSAVKMSFDYASSIIVE